MECYLRINHYSVESYHMQHHPSVVPVASVQDNKNAFRFQISSHYYLLDGARVAIRDSSALCE